MKKVDVFFIVRFYPIVTLMHPPDACPKDGLQACQSNYCIIALSYELVRMVLEKLFIGCVNTCTRGWGQVIAMLQYASINFVSILVVEVMIQTVGGTVVQ